MGRAQAGLEPVQRRCRPPGVVEVRRLRKRGRRVVPEPRDHRRPPARCRPAGRTGQVPGPLDIGGRAVEPAAQSGYVGDHVVGEVGISERDDGPAAPSGVQREQVAAAQVRADGGQGRAVPGVRIGEQPVEPGAVGEVAGVGGYPVEVADQVRPAGDERLPFGRRQATSPVGDAHRIAA